VCCSGRRRIIRIRGRKNAAMEQERHGYTMVVVVLRCGVEVW
jgi:hypothetical protein